MKWERSTSMPESPNRTGAVTLTVAILAIVAGLIPAAASAMSSPDQLAAQGWDCGLTPPNVSPTRVVCGNPGTGRPFPGNPDPRPTYRLWLFSTEGDYVARVHLVRADLYAGQPCNGGDAYVLRPLIGYYECLGMVGP